MNQATAGQSQSEPMPLEVLMGGVRNVLANKYKLLIAGLLAGGAAWYLSGLIPPKYASTVTLQIDGAINGRPTEAAAPGAPTDKTFLYTQYEVMTSRGLAEFVAEKAEPGTTCTLTPEEMAAAGGVQALAFDLMRNIEILPVRNTNLFRITAYCFDPETARNVAELFATSYKDFMYGDFNTEKNLAADWMNERMLTLKEAVEKSEKELQEYKEREAVYSSTLDGKIGNVELESLLGAYSAEQEKVAQLSAVHSQIRSLGEYYDVNDLTAIGPIRDDRIVSKMLEEISTVSANYSQLRERFMDDHPNLQEERIRYNELMRELRAQVSTVAKGISQELQSSKAAMKNLEKQLEQTKTASISQDRQRAVLAQLEESVVVNRDLYRQFLEQMSDLTHAQGYVGNQIKVIEKAYISNRPASPDRGLFAAAGFAGMTFLLSLFFMVRGLRDTTVKAPAEVELKLSSLLLGYLPKVKTNRSDLAYNGYLETSNGMFSEAIRSIRTSLTLLGMDMKHKVTVITSSVQNEGKSTVAMNLAASFSRLERTLLIDADVRRPTLAKSLGFPESTPGLINALADGVDITDCIYPGQPGNCDFMPTGRASALFFNNSNLPGSPLELLSSHRFRELVSRLREHYDHIIIDAAPVCGVSDTKVLCAVATHVVYVVAAHETDSRLVKQGIRELEHSQARVAGVVLNNVDMKKLRQYNYGQYGSPQMIAQEELA